MPEFGLRLYSGVGVGRCGYGCVTVVWVWYGRVGLWEKGKKKKRRRGRIRCGNSKSKKKGVAALIGIV